MPSGRFDSFIFIEEFPPLYIKYHKTGIFSQSEEKNVDLKAGHEYAHNPKWNSGHYPRIGVYSP